MFLTIIKIIFLKDLQRFLDFWFIHGPKQIVRFFFDAFYVWDKTISFRATFRNFFVPLYGDHTILGHIIAFIYRLIILSLATFILIFIALFFISFLIIWSLFPFLIFFYGFLFR